MLVDPSASAAASVPSLRAAAPLSRVRAGSVDDAKRVRATLQALLRTRERQSEYLEAPVESAQAKAIHLLLTGPDGAFFPDWESFVTCRAPYGLGVALEALDAVIEERKDPRRRAQTAAVLVGHGQHRGRRPELPGTVVPRGGTGTDYYLARIKLDHPDVLQALQEGRFHSVYEAALACGIAVPQCYCRLTPESFARQALKYLGAAGVAALIALLQHPEQLPSSQSRPQSPQRQPMAAAAGGARYAP
jgi:hypothetical protein